MPCLYHHQTKTGTQLNFLRLCQKKYKEAKIKRPSLSLNSTSVGILIPLAACSISVSVLWKIVWYIYKAKEKAGLQFCRRFLLQRNILQLKGIQTPSQERRGLWLQRLTATLYCSSLISMFWFVLSFLLQFYLSNDRTLMVLLSEYMAAI